LSTIQLFQSLQPVAEQTYNDSIYKTIREVIVSLNRSDTAAPAAAPLAAKRLQSWSTCI